MSSATTAFDAYHQATVQAAKVVLLNRLWELHSSSEPWVVTSQKNEKLQIVIDCLYPVTDATPKAFSLLKDLTPQVMRHHDTILAYAQRMHTALNVLYKSSSTYAEEIHLWMIELLDVPPSAIGLLPVYLVTIDLLGVQMVRRLYEPTADNNRSMFRLLRELTIIHERNPETKRVGEANDRRCNHARLLARAAAAHLSRRMDADYSPSVECTDLWWLLRSVGEAHVRAIEFMAMGGVDRLCRILMDLRDDGGSEQKMLFELLLRLVTGYPRRVAENLSSDGQHILDNVYFRQPGRAWNEVWVLIARATGETPTNLRWLTTMNSPASLSATVRDAVVTILRRQMDALYPRFLDDNPTNDRATKLISEFAEAETLRDSARLLGLDKEVVKLGKLLDELEVRASFRRLDVSDDVPHEFVCPITLCLMWDPVVASDGRTYELRALQRILGSLTPVSPWTREPLTQTIIRNHQLRERIRGYRAQTNAAA